jgi:hypothetical protein
MLVTRGKMKASATFQTADEFGTGEAIAVRTGCPRLRIELTRNGSE